MSSTICIFSSLYLPHVGGVETYTYNLAKALVEMDHRVIVVTSNTENMPTHTIDEDIEIIRLPCYNILGGRFPYPHKNKEYKAEINWLQEQQLDGIIVNARFYPHSIEGLKLASKMNIIPLLIEHGSAHLTMGNDMADKIVHFAEHHITNRALKYDFDCYAVSKKAGEWVSHFGIKPESKESPKNRIPRCLCGELSNSIDADEYVQSASNRNFKDRYNINDETFIVSFVGRLVPEKGAVEAARAFNYLGPSISIAAFIAGDGPCKADIEKLHDPRINLLGKLSPDDVAALLLQSDVLCLPSRSEGFATTLLEAAACFTPAIATNVGGTDELIPDESFGTVIKDRKPKTVARAIQYSATHKEEVIAQGMRVHKRVQEMYSWRATAQKALQACKYAQR